VFSRHHGLLTINNIAAVKLDDNSITTAQISSL